MNDERVGTPGGVAQEEDVAVWTEQGAVTLRLVARGQGEGTGSHEAEMRRIAARLTRWVEGRRNRIGAGAGDPHDGEIAMVQTVVSVAEDDAATGRRRLLSVLTEMLADGRARHPLALSLAARLLALGMPDGNARDPAPQSPLALVPRVHLRLFGRFGLSVDGVPVHFPRRAPRRLLLLLQWLAVRGERGVPVMQLADTLWPEAEGDRAQNALKVAVHRLRGLLRDPGAVVVDDGVVRLAAAAFTTDVRDFECFAQKALERRASDDLEGFERIARAALALHVAPVLAGEEVVPWLAEVRERVGRRLGELTVALGRHLELTGRGEDARALYELVLEREPLAEPVHHALMTLHLHRGQFREAIGAYERCAVGLLQGLRLQPSPQLQALHRHAVAQWRCESS